MRKFLPLVVVGFLVLSGLGAVAVSNDETELKQTSVVFSQPVLQSENEYLTVSIDEANTFLMKQGKPMLPSYVETFAFEFGTEIKSVKCTPTNIQTQTILEDIMPTPQAVIVGQKATTSIKVPIKYAPEPYPTNWFEYDISSGMYNRERSIIVEVQVNPIKYYSQGKVIEYIAGVDIEIEYESPSQQSSPRDEYQLIVIGPDEFSDELAPLITHKIGRGVTAKFAGLSEVYGGTGRDNQEKIKYYIKDAIETWSTSNVLLVGGSAKFPTRTTHIYIDLSPDPPDDEIFVSDLYYADIYDGTGGFCSWDSNGNDIFGEYDWNGETDDVDLHPDVYLGRWACTTGSQVITCVNKVKTYENTPAYQQAWFTNLVVVGGDSFPDNNDVDEGEYINQKVIDIMSGFIPEKLWVTNGKLTSWVPTGVANIKNAINDGCGFVDFSGHGNTNVWATHPHNDHSTWVPTPLGHITSSDIQTLTNGDELPIVTVEACSTAKFASDSNCFNWAFIHNSNGGAIGSFGATALGWGYIGTGVSQGLIGKIGLDTFRAYKLDGSITFGEMWAKALERYIEPGMDGMDYKTVEEWQPFGDPTLAIGEESQAPAKPATPSGPASGGAGTTYTYTTSTTDPDGDDVYYLFDWGDETYSGWVGPYASGATGSASHEWTTQGDYEIRVVAKDDHGVTSVWSDPLPITMPLNVNQQSTSPQSVFLQVLQQLLGQSVMSRMGVNTQ